jgi:hypothetical protein
MTHRQRRSLAKYVSAIAVTLGLRDWTLSFPEDPPENDDAIASVECIYGRRMASVRFDADFLSFSCEDQRVAVLHELIHVHFWHRRQATKDALEGIGREAREIAFDAITLGDEYGTDAVADAIAPFFPFWEGCK